MDANDNPSGAAASIWTRAYYEAAFIFAYLRFAMTAMNALRRCPDLFDAVVASILREFHVVLVPGVDAIYLTHNYLSACNDNHAGPFSPFGFSCLRLKPELYKYLRRFTIIIPTHRGYLTDHLLGYVRQGEFLGQKLPPGFLAYPHGPRLDYMHDMLRVSPHSLERWQLIWKTEDLNAKQDLDNREHHMNRMSNWVGDLMLNLDLDAVETLALEFQEDRDGLGRACGSDGYLVHDILEVAAWASGGVFPLQVNAIIGYY